MLARNLSEARGLCNWVIRLGHKVKIYPPRMIRDVGKSAELHTARNGYAMAQGMQ